MRISGLLILCFSVLVAVGANAANQSVKVTPDGKIVFAAAISGVTRLSIRGEDRLKEIWSNNSAFEAQVNGDTGDMYLRYIGTGSAQKEDGFLITEKGFTINYTLRPSSSTSETVLIGLEVPAPKSQAITAKPGFATSSKASADGYTGGIVACVRQIYAQFLDGRTPPRVKTEPQFDVSTVKAARAASWWPLHQGRGAQCKRKNTIEMALSAFL